MDERGPTAHPHGVPTTLHQQDAALVQRHDELPPEHGAILDATEWGTEGVRFVVHGRAAALVGVDGVHRLTLDVGGLPAGAYVLREQPVRVGATRVRGFYRGLVTVAPFAMGAGRGRALFETARRYTLEVGEPAVCYGYIEDENVRSMRTAKRVGYTPFGEIETLPMSRVRPRDVAGVRALRGDELPELRRRLSDLYAGHGLLDLEASVVDDGRWHVLEEGGRWRAAAWIQPREWSFTNMPGASGLAMKYVLRYVPWLRRVIPYPRFEFLQLQALWCEPGDEGQVLRLVEALMARAGRHLGLMYVDPESPIYGRLDGAPLGAIDRVADRGRAVVMAGAADVSDDDMDALRAGPLWVSPRTII